MVAVELSGVALFSGVAGSPVPDQRAERLARGDVLPEPGAVDPRRRRPGRYGGEELRMGDLIMRASAPPRGPGGLGGRGHRSDPAPPLPRGRRARLDGVVQQRRRAAIERVPDRPDARLTLD